MSVLSVLIHMSSLYIRESKDLGSRAVEGLRLSASAWKKRGALVCDADDTLLVL